MGSLPNLALLDIGVNKRAWKTDAEPDPKQRLLQSPTHPETRRMRQASPAEPPPHPQPAPPQPAPPVISETPQEYHVHQNRYDWAVSASKDNGVQWSAADPTWGTRVAEIARNWDAEHRGVVSESGAYNYGTKDIPFAKFPETLRSMMLKMNGNEIEDVPNVFVRWPDLRYFRESEGKKEAQYSPESEQIASDELRMTLRFAELGLTPRVLMALPVMVNEESNPMGEYIASEPWPTRRVIVYVQGNLDTELYSYLKRSPDMTDNQISNLARRIQDVIQNVATQGFMLADNKTTNMVVREDGCDDFVVKVIDIDPIFTFESRAEVPISPLCAEFVALVVFLVFMYNFGTVSTNEQVERAQRIIFYKLLERLRFVFDTLDRKTPDEMTSICYDLLQDPYGVAPKTEEKSVQAADAVRLSSMLRMNNNTVKDHAWRVALKTLLTYAHNEDLETKEEIFNTVSETRRTVTAATVRALETLALKNRPKTYAPLETTSQSQCALMGRADW